MKELKMVEQKLKSIYYNPGHYAGFGGVRNLVRAVREEGFESTSSQRVKNWLMKQDAYTLHKPVRKSFKRNQVRVRGIDENWQADLVDVQNLKQFNGGYRYLLTCIDVLSKYAWAVPLKSKLSKDVVKAFESILQEGRVPIALHTDKGSEFINKDFQKCLKAHAIHFFTTENEMKGFCIERFHRTLRTRMAKYFTYHNTYKYIPILKELLKGYNATTHSSIGMKPSEVTIENQHRALNALYGQRKEGEKKTVKPFSFKFHIGDQVRVSKVKMRFAKGYEANWSEEIFTIAACVKRKPPVYKIEDYNGEQLRGTFYETELQTVKKAKEDRYLVEKVIRTRVRNKSKQYFVRWKGYGKEFDSWVERVADKR